MANKSVTTKAVRVANPPAVEVGQFQEMISRERSRTYIFPKGEVTIEDVVRVCVRPSGTHRLETAGGGKYIVRKGWLTIKIDADRWSFEEVLMDERVKIQILVTNSKTGDEVFSLAVDNVTLEDIVEPGMAGPGIKPVAGFLLNNL